MVSKQNEDTPDRAYVGDSPKNETGLIHVITIFSSCLVISWVAPFCKAVTTPLVSMEGQRNYSSANLPEQKYLRTDHRCIHQPA